MTDVRSAIEQVTGGWRFRRRLPATFGHAPLWVSPGSGLRYLLKPMAAIDPGLLSLVVEFVRPGDCVWDVGANLGLFSVAAAHVAASKGAVISVEPDAWLVQLLRRSASLQSALAAPMTVVPAAVADTLDIKTFCIAKRARAANFLAGHGSSQSGGVREEQTVVTVTLDWLAERLRAPQLIKIDVEGAELGVLRGATGILSRERPYILCEVAGDTAGETGEFLRGLDYVIYDGGLPLVERKPLTDAPWSTIALPAEKVTAHRPTRT